jgi:NCAIR mutase (PurE)-related protein
VDAITVASVLTALQRGELPLDAAVNALLAGRPGTAPNSEETDEAHVDLARQARCGFPEVVYSPGKPTEAIVRIFETQLARGQECFATRVSAEQAEGIQRRLPAARHNAVARTIRLSPERDPDEDASTTAGRVVVVTAGTSDRPIAEEALETVRWMGVSAELIVDVGVAGPHRLLEKLPRLAGADAVIVVAGMEGALPSVVGGWVDVPIVAVPTSVGYGASFGGVSALLGMLNSCASNVTVVNIDAGFKAGYVCGMIARRCAAARDRA